MENKNNNSLHIHQPTPNNNLVTPTCKTIQPNLEQLGIFSCLQLAKLKKAMLECRNYYCDPTPHRISEDVQSNYLKTKFKGLSSGILLSSSNNGNFCNLKNQSKQNAVKHTNSPRQRSFNTKQNAKLNLIPLCKATSNSDSSHDSFYLKQTECQPKKQKLLRHESCHHYRTSNPSAILRQSITSNLKTRTGVCTADRTRKLHPKTQSNCLDLQTQKQCFFNQPTEKNSAAPNGKDQESPKFKVFQRSPAQKVHPKVLHKFNLKICNKLTPQTNKIRVKKKVKNTYKNNENAYTNIDINHLNLCSNHKRVRTQISLSTYCEDVQNPKPFENTLFGAGRQKISPYQINQNYSIKIHNPRALQFMTLDQSPQNCFFMPQQYTDPKISSPFPAKRNPKLAPNSGCISPG